MCSMETDISFILKLYILLKLIFSQFEFLSLENQSLSTTSTASIGLIRSLT